MEIINVVILSILFAGFMKVTYSIIDGSIKTFDGADIATGFLWGVFGSYLILYDNTLANVWLAVLLGWILRSKISHFSNALAGTMMLLTFLLNNNNFLFQRTPFLIFFFGMALSGLPHDYLYKHGIMSRQKSELFQTIVFYTLLPLAYSITTGNWLVFASLFSFVIVYEAERRLIKKKNDEKKPARRIAVEKPIRRMTAEKTVRRVVRRKSL